MTGIKKKKYTFLELEEWMKGLENLENLEEPAYTEVDFVKTWEWWLTHKTPSIA